jgi:glycosyltransferase involved in cell wall biosynthesis
MSVPPAPNSPCISIIIPTYNRAQILPRLIDALAAQTYPAAQFEIVIVDDGSNDGTQEVLRRLSASLPDRLIWTRQENAGPGVARNLGARTARGDLLYFIDDDCLPDPDWLQRASGTFASYRRPTALTSGISVANPDDPLNWYFRRQSEIVQASELAAEAHACTEVVPGNCMMHREDFWAVGGNDADRRVGETEGMSRQMLALGITMMYVPQLRLPHLIEHRQTPADYFRYYAYTGACNCQREMRQNPKAALSQLLRITATLPLLPLRLVKNLQEYRRTSFAVHWWYRFLLMDIAGLIGYRVGFWRQFLQGGQAPDGRPVLYGHHG